MGDLFSQQLFLTSLLFLTPQLDFLSLSADNLTSTSSVPQNVSIHSFLFSYPSPLLSPKANLSTALDPSLPLPYGIPRGYFFSSGIFRLHLYWLCPAYKHAQVCLKELSLDLGLLVNDTLISLLPSASKFLKR